MSKRTPGLPRKEKDNYPTPPEALDPAIQWIRKDGVHFCEPCAGEGQLVDALRSAGFKCSYAGDIRHGQDAMKWMNRERVMIVTNPPWERSILHPMIEHFLSFKRPVWLLLDADWMHTKQAVPYLESCSTIVSVGRVKWIPGTDMTGFDNVAWYRFWYGRLAPHIAFIPRLLP